MITVGLLFTINKYVSTNMEQDNTAAEYAWISHGILNILGYSTILIPGYIIYVYVTKISYLEKNRKQCECGSYKNFI